LALKVFVVVTAPLCWSTDVLQSDAATITTALAELPKISAHFEKNKNEAQVFPPHVQDMMLNSIRVAEESLQRRKAQYLHNLFTLTLGQLESPNALSYDEIAALANTIRRYFRTVNFTIQGELDEEISKFNFRPDEARVKPNYWSEEGKQLVLLSRFRKDIAQILCTEAACERSFAIEGDLWNKKRNRLSVSNVEDAVFVAMNFRKLRLKIQEHEMRHRSPRQLEVGPTECERLVETLRDQAPRTPRAKRNLPNVNNITRGSCVEVKFYFKEGRAMVEKWSTGVVVEVLANKKNEYRVCWDEYEGAAKISDFCP
jgi:hypothetical protein